MENKTEVVLQKHIDANATILTASAPDAVVDSSSMQYAGWFFRVGATILDVILYIIMFRVLLAIFPFFLSWLSILIPLSLYIVLEIWQGSSLGKKVFGLHVVSTKGTKLSRWRAFGRECVFGLVLLGMLFSIEAFIQAESAYVAWKEYGWLISGILSLIPSIATCITMIFSSTKQTFYDKWFGSVVLSRDKNNVERFVLALAEIVVVVFGLLILYFLTTYHGKL